MEMFDRRKDGPYDEVVFCGYGEPTERLDVMLSLCDHIKNTTALRTRLIPTSVRPYKSQANGKRNGRQA